MVFPTGTTKAAEDPRRSGHESSRNPSPSCFMLFRLVVLQPDSTWRILFGPSHILPYPTYSILFDLCRMLAIWRQGTGFLQSLGSFERFGSRAMNRPWPTPPRTWVWPGWTGMDQGQGSNRITCAKQCQAVPSSANGSKMIRVWRCVKGIERVQNGADLNGHGMYWYVWHNGISLWIRELVWIAVTDVTGVCSEAKTNADGIGHEMRVPISFRVER